MGRNAKPISMCTGARTKEEIEQRTQGEEKLKGSSNLPIEVPDFLVLDEIGKKIYSLMLEHLPEEILNYLDVFNVGICCDALSKMIECQRILRSEGLLVEYTNKAGATNISEHKAISIYQKYSTIYNTYGSKLGLSPVDRGKLVALTTKETELDEFELLLNS